MSASGSAGNRPLRILQVVPSMGAEAGGPPVVAAGLAGALARRGHAVHIAAVQFPGQGAIEVDARVGVHLFPLTGLARYAASRGLEEWLDGHVRDFDILHLHSLWQFPTFAAARAARRGGGRRVPYVTVLHGMLDRYSVGQRSGLLKRAYWIYRERGIQAGAAAIHCLNEAEIENAVPWIKGYPKFILPNGIAEGELEHLPAGGRFRGAHGEIGDRPLVLFLSRVHPKKGLEGLIPAWRAVVERVPEVRLAIAGTGEAEYLARIDGLIARSGLQKNIVRVGQLVGEKKWEALVDADLFVLPSHQEGFSMAITEALAAGCPVVATSECNFKKLEETVPACGVVIRDHDMGAFAEAVVELLMSPERRGQMAAAARGVVEARYTWEKIAGELEARYRGIIEK